MKNFIKPSLILLFFFAFISIGLTYSGDRYYSAERPIMPDPAPGWHRPVVDLASPADPPNDGGPNNGGSNDDDELLGEAGEVNDDHGNTQSGKNMSDHNSNWHPPQTVKLDSTTPDSGFVLPNPSFVSEDNSKESKGVDPNSSLPAANIKNGSFVKNLIILSLKVHIGYQRVIEKIPSYLRATLKNIGALVDRSFSNAKEEIKLWMQNDKEKAIMSLKDRVKNAKSVNEGVAALDELGRAARSGDQEATAALIDLAKNVSNETDCCGRRPSPYYTNKFYLRDAPIIKMEAMENLGYAAEGGNQEATAALKDFARTADTKKKRVTAINNLSRAAEAGNKEATAALIDLARSAPHEEVRMAAIVNLGYVAQIEANNLENATGEDSQEATLALEDLVKNAQSEDEKTAAREIVVSLKPPSLAP